MQNLDVFRLLSLDGTGLMMYSGCTGGVTVRITDSEDGGSSFLRNVDA
jgi:hypothetical protein